MHIDARELENDSTIEGDLCIVGAGAAGISMALDWIGSGKKVILLESGGFEYDPRIQELNSGNSTGQKYYPLMSTRLRYFGGTTGHWEGMCSPLDEIDFMKRAWVPHSGWPIGKADLEPFYEKAHKTLELGPYNYELDYWRDRLSDSEPFYFDETVVWNKIWQFSPARFGKLYREQIVNSADIQLYTHASAVDIRLTENLASVNSIIIKNHQQKQHTVKAKRFVLACGTIQNTRLMLASNQQLTSGIGNQHDLVGRFFMEHVELSSAELWVPKPINWKFYRYRPGVSEARAELAIAPKVQETSKMLNGTASLRPLGMARNLKPFIETWQQDDPRQSAETSYNHMSEAARTGEASGRNNQGFDLFTRMEQAPNPNSRITLSTERDELGVPKASLHWELTPLEKNSYRIMYHILGNEMGRSGIGRIKLHQFLRDDQDASFPEGVSGGWHHMGTARMSDDPKTGVVDRNCKVHQVSNLYVAGAACFTTSGAVNPTLTLTALALRLSDHLKEMKA